MRSRELLSMFADGEFGPLFSTQESISWLPVANEFRLWIESAAEPTNRAGQNFHAFVQFGDGNELSGAMGHPDVAGAEHHGFGAQRDEARGFGPEGHRAGRLPGRRLEEFNDLRFGDGLEAFI